MTPIRSVLSHRVGRIAIAVFALAYVATWVFGVPAVVSHNDRWVVEEFKRVVSNGERTDVSSSHPSFDTLAAVPACPGLVVSLRTYAVAGRYGWGGVQADVWWPGAVRPWFKITLFVS
jgi:hypothetical protein